MSLRKLFPILFIASLFISSFSIPAFAKGLSCESILNSALNNHFVDQLYLGGKENGVGVNVHSEEWSINFHKILIGISQLPKKTREQVLEDVDQLKYATHTKKTIKLALLSTEDWDNYLQQLIKKNSRIPSLKGSNKTKYGIYSTLFHIIRNAPKSFQDYLMGRLTELFKETEHNPYSGESPRNTFRQIMAGLTHPYYYFHLNSNRPAEEIYASYIEQMRNTYFLMGHDKYTSRVIFDVKLAIEAISVLYPNITILLYGSYPGGLAKIGKSDIDIHIATENKEIKDEILNKIRAQLSEVFVKLSITTDDLKDDFVGGQDPLIFLSTSPVFFIFEGSHTKIRVNHPNVIVDKKGKPIKAGKTFLEFDI